MARLKVFQNGQFIIQHELDPSGELLAGRGETCQIVLDPEKGISRQHFRIRFIERKWVVEVLSRYGELYVGGEKKSIFGLTNGDTFSVPPYEFVFESEDGASLDGTGSSELEDRTQIGIMPSLAFLRLTDARGETKQVFQLEGSNWIAGRDTSSTIFIDNKRISRQQFEIQKSDEQYFIRDLSGVNPTLLNGRGISNEEWTSITSGDVIGAADISIVFELRDPSFDSRLQTEVPSIYGQLTPYASSPGVDGSSAGADGDMSTAGVQQISYHGHESPIDPLPPLASKGLFGVPWLNPIRLVIALVLVGAVGYQVYEDNKPEPEVRPENLSPFAKLTPEKQAIVKQLYLTSQALLAQEKYEMARQEITKLHQILPYYEDSKQIENAITQSLINLEEKQRFEAQEREKLLIEEKIAHQAGLCKQQLRSTSDLNWLENCLSSVSQFNPEHPLFVELRNKVQAQMDLNLMKEVQRKEYLMRVAQLKSLYDKASKIEKDGKPMPAIAAYKKVASSKLPDPNGLVSKARRQMASLQSEVDRKQEEAEKKSDEAYRSGKLKEALLVLRDGIRLNPDNEVLKGRHEQLLVELKKSMQNQFQEAVLEESVGDVESAKMKWKKIIDQSLPGEDYYEKSKIKLKKYGNF